VADRGCDHLARSATPQPRQPRARHPCLPPSGLARSVPARPGAAGRQGSPAGSHPCPLARAVSAARPRPQPHPSLVGGSLDQQRPGAQTPAGPRGPWGVVLSLAAGPAGAAAPVSPPAHGSPPWSGPAPPQPQELANHWQALTRRSEPLIAALYLTASLALPPTDPAVVVRVITARPAPRPRSPWRRPGWRSPYQGIAKRPEMAGKAIEFRVAMRPGQRRVLPDTAEGRLLNLIEMAKAGTASACSSPHQSQRGAPLPGREAAIQLSEDEAEGNGEKSLQGACACSAGKPFHGSPCATGADMKRGLIGVPIWPN